MAQETHDDICNEKNCGFGNKTRDTMHKLKRHRAKNFAVEKKNTKQTNTYWRKSMPSILTLTLTPTPKPNANPNPNPLAQVNAVNPDGERVS